MSGSRKIGIFLSLPRTGTHFVWSRLVASGRYQLIYDADRVAALAVLREEYDKPLEFLYPAPLNPNYNFQYNSVREAPGPLNADGHLALLARKYRCSGEPEELFHRIMAHQDNGTRTLFSVNRFVYTCRYSHPFRDFVWSISMATRALALFEEWLGRGPYEHRTTIIVREIEEWVRSQVQMQGRRGLRFVRERLEDFPHIMEACAKLRIPVYDTPQAIAAMSRGELDFQDAIEPLPGSEIERMCGEARDALPTLAEQRGASSLFRPRRFMQYLSETDPVKRLSLVRSIGRLPVAAAPMLPVLGKMIRKDYEGVLLDNGRIDLEAMSDVAGKAEAKNLLLMAQDALRFVTAVAGGQPHDGHNERPFLDAMGSRADPATRSGIADQFQVVIAWTHDDPLLPGRPYLVKLGAHTVTATVTHLRYRIDADTLEHIAAQELRRDEIAVCNLATERPIAFDAYAQNRTTGGFVLLDKLSNADVGAGAIRFALRRADNLHWQAVDVHKAARAEAKRQKPRVLWFTGLSGAGKSSIANFVEKRLHAQGRHTYLLDGDNVRHGLNRDLGFTDADRVENIRRIAEVAKLMADAGLIVLVSFISPFRAERRMARELLEPGEFCEIFVDTPLEEAERRDTKGLYRKARRGELAHFTGIDSPYEVPENPEIRIDTLALSVEEASERIVRYVSERL